MCTNPHNLFQGCASDFYRGKLPSNIAYPGNKSGTIYASSSLIA